MIQRLAIIGVGLIGGSLALALKEKQVVAHIVGSGRSEENLKLAEELGIVDSWTTSLVDAVRDADIVLLSVPMGAYDDVLSEISPALKNGAIVTDAGSVKEHALEAANRHLPQGVTFVAGHPLAGTEKSGASASFAELYQDKICILTPNENTQAAALAKVARMWEEVGAQIVNMPAKEHDEMLAAVSHLPHVAAFALVNTVNGQKTETFNPFAYAAGGFRDFTRIASSHPTMWRDIALTNKKAMIKQIEQYETELDAIKQALINDDAQTLLKHFSSAKDSRDAWLASNVKGE